MNKFNRRLLLWMFNFLNMMDSIGVENAPSVQRAHLILSSRDNPMDQVMSMELGADDYMQNHFIPTCLLQNYKRFIVECMSLA